MAEQLMKCRRCRKVTLKSALVDAPKKRGQDYIELCCPNCGCKTFTVAGFEQVIEGERQRGGKCE